ncbi:unnamed protein product [Enterobius vermicularis]|uniref:Muscleblind-like protein n=1 Tax=Enterobius vermicularis TaxID=51028 RepID=A0A158QAX3_ENTVE|nr:unnamed protein product [Enterobius vermicularis]
MYDENSNTTISALGTSTSSSGIMNQILNVNVKDSRWLQLEVCREFQRGQCSRSDEECKFAHPPPHVDVQNGRVTACYDSIKGRCTRENPKCKYLHPPQHLKDQLLINGRNNLALKNLICTQLNQTGAATNIPPINPLAQLVVGGQPSPAISADSLLLVQQQQQAAAAQATLIPAAALPYQYYQGLTAMYPAMMPVASTEAYQTVSQVAIKKSSIYIRT